MSVEAPFRTDLTVTGMTCQHCVASVTEEVGEISGVRSVEVTLDSGAVTVHSDRELTSEELATAIDEAGYAVSG